MAEQIEGEIVFECENVDLPDLHFATIHSWIHQVVASYNKQCGDICYIFCNDEKILEVNRQYLDHDYFTDIITFDYTEADTVSGDLFISLDTISSNAKKYRTDYTEELLRVMIHGVLHLCGFKDKSKEESITMRQQEDLALLIYNSF